MPVLAHIVVDESQFPEKVRCDLLESLRSRKVNHKFHYDSVKQTQKWLELHEAYSPARTDPNCTAIYEAAFARAAQEIQGAPIRVIGLGCGGGQKDTSLLRMIRTSGQLASYTPCDVSTAMVLVARELAVNELPVENCFPLVCDLATAQDLRSIVSANHKAISVNSGCVFTFFGMLPNFEPEVILPRLAGLIDPGDLLLLSANLAPGDNYTRGVQRVLPLYDNELTREWLITFLLDLGIEKTDGHLRFGIEQTYDPVPLQRVVANFQFVQKRSIQVSAEHFEFRPGENIRLFFSYRHTPELVRILLGGHGLEVVEQWVTASKEEGVFLVRRKKV